MPKETAIFEKAADCLHAFNSCIESATVASWPQEQLDRFNLWAAHGGIFGDYASRTSMDWRLRDRPELADMMLELLDLLQEYLSHIPALAKVGPSASSGLRDAGSSSCGDDLDVSKSRLSGVSSTTSTNSSSVCSINVGPLESDVTVDRRAEVQRDAEDTITKLFRLSAVIRSVGMSYRYEKAQNFIEWENGVNVTTKFRDGIKLLLKHKRPQPLEYMISRLLESICLRQKQMAYSQHHKRIKGLPKSGAAGPSGAAPSGLGRGVPSAVYTATYVPATVSATATRFTTPRLAQQEFSTIDNSLDMLPPPPSPKGRKTEFECPFCAVPLVEREYQGAAWRTHILQDIRPYVCVLPDCKTPHALYVDGISWMGHIQSAHTTTHWKCAAVSHSEAPVFETESQFIAHVNSEHEELFNEEEVAELANLSSFERPRTLDESLWPECPICTESFDGNDFLSVFCHIAKDLVEYAVLSLPDPP
ncbi:hypothetical protein GQ53DRAFT_880990, partial [Thozetella sp. PMI_491]